METRKIQKVGGSTFTVSLPKEWTTNHDLEAGMEIRVYTHRDGSVLLRSSAADVGYLSDATVELDGDSPQAAARMVRAAHMVGFETITLRRNGSFTDAERDAVQSTVHELVGTNIFAESDAEITIRHLLDTSSVSVRQSVVQLQHVIVPLLGDATETFLDPADKDTGICDRATEAYRSVEMVTRHFFRSLISYAELDELGVSRPELFAYYQTTTHLESVIEQAVSIAEMQEHHSEPVPEEFVVDVRSVADDVACAVDNAVTAVLNEDITEGQQARKRCDDAIKRIETAEQRLYNGTVSDPAQAVAISTTLTHLRGVATHSCSIADIAKRTAIRANNIDL